MQGNHVDGEATNLWTERRAVEAKGGADEEGGRGVMHEGTPSPSSCWRFLGVFCECLVCVCLLSCFRSTPQAGEAAGSRDAAAIGRCGTGGIFSMVNDGGHGVANLS